MKYAFHTEAGGHVRNEDAVAFRPHPNQATLIVGALGDGQGGQAGGARAARLAVDTCIAEALACSPGRLVDPSTWLELCEKADHVVSNDPEAGFTTLVGMAISDAAVAGASSGDSAAYLWANDRLELLTNTRLKHPAVGSSAARFAMFSVKLAAPWRLLVVSDGVWKYVNEERLSEYLASLSGEKLITALRDDVQRNFSGRLPDDFSAAVIEP